MIKAIANSSEMAYELANAIPFKRFESKLRIQRDDEASLELDKNYYRVLDSFKFYYGSSEEDGRWVLVPEGFLTDGATIPRLLWWLLPPWDNYSQSAALHDYLVEYGVMYDRGEIVTCTRKQADHIFREAMKVAGVKAWPRQAMYWAVRLWGKYGKRPNPRLVARKRELDAQWEFASTNTAKAAA